MSLMIWKQLEFSFIFQHQTNMIDEGKEILQQIITLTMLEFL